MRQVRRALWVQGELEALCCETRVCMDMCGNLPAVNIPSFGVGLFAPLRQKDFDLAENMFESEAPKGGSIWIL